MTDKNAAPLRVALFADLTERQGISMEIYANALVNGLRALSAPEVIPRVCRPKLIPLIDRFQPVLRHIPRLRLVSNDLNLSRFVTYPAMARFHQGDVNHILDHSNGHLVLSLDSDRTVVTCHDLMPLKLNPREGWKKNPLLRLFLRSAVSMRRAARIIAVSESTKRDLRDLLDMPEEKIIVILEAVDPVFAREPAADLVAKVEERYRLGRLKGRRTLFHVGNNMRHKGIEELLRALHRLLPLYPDLCFVRAGTWLSDEQRNLKTELGLNDVVVELGPIASSEELAVLYRQMDLLVFPSAHEGFGFPVVESFASGLPVVASNRASLPEVSGGAALLVEPTPEEIAEGVRQVLDNDELRASLTARGRERSKGFDWSETARRTALVYEEVVSQRDNRPLSKRGS